ncbi:MAG: hypothetical protein LDL41_20755 [Coleofasciculus sp. S288]|nr:hypothetical protein [Coleofasciculus sp. S288]
MMNKLLRGIKKLAYQLFSVDILRIVFLLFVLVFFVGLNLQKPRVLILHSYATDFSWVNDINTGIERILANKPYSLRYHYMDTKRNPNQEFKEKAGKIARRIISEWDPNVIIAVDDNAQSMAAQYFANKPKMNIVFTGLNAEPEEYGYDSATNVTGILERIPFDFLKEVFLQVLPPDHRKIVHYSDDSETSDAIHTEIESFIWDPIELVEHRQIETFDEWKNAINNANQKADFILITHYHTIRRSATENAVVSPEEVMKWTIENSTLPDIGCWGFHVQDGGMLAFGVSPYEEGEEAAKMAVEIIEKRVQPKQIPIKTSNLFVVYMRESRLKKFGIELPRIYSAFAHATNNYYYN